MTSEAKPGCDIDGLCVHLLAAFACPHCSDVAPTKPPEAVKVTQTDRELYLALGIFHTCTDQAVLEWGWADNSPEMQRIARHREEAEKRIVDWLCCEAAMRFRLADDSHEESARHYNHTRGIADEMAAEAIERGARIQENSDGE